MLRHLLRMSAESSTVTMLQNCHLQLTYNNKILSFVSLPLIALNEVVVYMIINILKQTITTINF